MDEGRRWAIETFGAQGVAIREQVPQLVRAEHVASADAQEASGHRSLGVYGEYWRGIIERFEVFGKLPGATMIRPGQAPYRIPVINGAALFPWRYSRSQERALADTPFMTSPARAAMVELRGIVQQGELNLGIAPSGLTPEEQELADFVERTLADGAVTSGKLVVVAISSSPSVLHEITWGEVALNTERCLEFGFSESLINMAPTPPPKPYAVPAEPEVDRTFTTGEPPRKDIGMHGDTEGEAGSDGSSNG